MWKIKCFVIPTIIAPVLLLTGFRFSKDYRHGKTFWHRLVYALVSTPCANNKASALLAKLYYKDNN